MVAKVKESDFWFEKIPYLKAMKKFYSGINYGGINLWPVMAGEVYTDYFFSHIDLEEEPTFKQKVLFGMKNLFFRDRFPVTGKGNVLVSFFMDRADHHDFFKKSFSEFPKEEIREIDAFEYKQKSPFKKGRIVFPDLFLFFKIWNLFRKGRVKKTLKRYYWLHISKVYFRIKQIEYFERVIKQVKPKGYVAFCSSAFPEESILTLLCKKNKIPTFTLQHGFLSNYSPKFSSFLVQSENIISDYLLLWGDSSKETQGKFVEENRLVVVGNPKYQLLSKKPKEFTSKEATIFLSVPAYGESNRNLLKTVGEFAKAHLKVKFNVKLHPFDKVENYRNLNLPKNIFFSEKESKVDALLKKSNFIIVHSTSIAYEALIYSIPIFRFKDEFFADTWRHKDLFEDSTELENIFSNLKKKKNFEKFMDFYDKERRKTFYFEKEKKPSRVYYRKIMEKINEHNNLLKIRNSLKKKDLV